MGRQWTNQQKNAIYATDGSVLVSAAAGSGKTAVLVERVINLITREENAIDVDRLLVVTFTRAAAAEMKQRITLALNSLLENDPYNENLLRQKQLLYSASICTIDSFCSDIVREYFHVLDISGDFRIGDKSELELLSTQALENVFNRFYASDSSDFIALADAFSGKSGDTKLREIVLKTAEFLSTQPFPDKWIDKMLDNYRAASFAKSLWGKIILDHCISSAHYAVNLTQSSLKLLENDEKIKNSLQPRINEDLVFLETLLKKLYGGVWDEISKTAFSFSAGRLTPPKGEKDNPIKLAVSSNRNTVKNEIESIKSFFSQSEESADLELKEIYALSSTLFSVVTAYIEEFRLLKSKKNIMSFSDVELLTVKLLALPSGDGYIRTNTANEISKRYDAVMVDEFQDVNDVQDLIFKCVSRDENNIFAVGDVKQSIYGFRQAKPQIFINRKNSYKKYDGNNPEYPATIILDKNFRSRIEVCDAVNFVFSRLMTEHSARMDYTEDEMLNAGAQYRESDKCAFEISLIEKSAFENDNESQIEARYIADKIRSMMNSGFTVKDGDTERRATYGDFAVIMRSTKGRANIYVKTLNDFGIPAYSENKESTFESKEIKTVLNLMRVIDNPSRDIELLSVLCSPIYGFTPDELSEIRADSRYTSLYSALKIHSHNSEKTKAFLKELETLKNYSYITSVDELLEIIYETTSVSSIASAVGKGETPGRNLEFLRMYARDFQSNGYKSLSDFISYIDRLIESGSQLPAASDNADFVNSVRVMSIHSSKGLEFPVCFLADTAHSFNKNEYKSDVMIDSVAGLGIRKKDGMCRYPTVTRLSVEIEHSKNEMAEELRVLYVAFTRAKEKLIAIAAKSNIDKYVSDIYSKLIFGKFIEPYSVISANSISDWLVMCALVHPSQNSLRHKIDPLAEYLQGGGELDWKLNFIDSADNLSEIYSFDDDLSSFASEEVSSSGENFDYSQLLKENLAFQYKNADLISLPQKVTASEISHPSGGEFERVLRKPRFIADKDNTGVERGTAHHRFLQYCDFKNARTDISGEIERLAFLGVLTENQASLIDREKITRFLKSELFDRVINSPHVMREERFAARLKPSQLFDGISEQSDRADIIVQGAVDLAFEEDGKLVVVDYKTDRVNDVSKLVSNYEKQLEIYKLSMEQTTGIPVCECIIYSVHLGECIKL